MRYFTYYWNQDQFLVTAGDAARKGPIYLDYTGGSGFRDRGVAPGDVLYVLTWYKGDLRVLGRMLVDGVLDEAAAQRRIGSTYPAPEHVVASPGTATPFVYDAVIYDESLDDLTFLTADGAAASVKRNQSGKVEPQTFRNVREITKETADIFDTELGFDQSKQLRDGELERLVLFSVLIRDDDANDAEGEFEVLCRSASKVPPRVVELDHSTADRESLSDDARLAELMRTVIEDWCSKEGFLLEPNELGAAIDNAFQGATAGPLSES